MLKVLTKKLRAQTLNEIQPFQLKISYSPRNEDDSDDSEGENQELALIDQESQRNCRLSSLSPICRESQKHLCKVRTVFDPLDCESSEEELERINREFGGEKRKWSQVNRLSCYSDSASSSDEEVKDLCGMSFKPVPQADQKYIHSSPVPFSATPPKRLHPLVQRPSGQIILHSVGTSVDQATPCKRHRQGQDFSRPSLDLEKMQQSISGSCPPPRYLYNPSSFTFRPLSTLTPVSSMAPVEEPPCAY
ncbi:uncharacterized protein si:dkey-16j16.4 isoform X3 [Hemiscyllium ocellatum]|uniref:uncharacterized protein si:dkey-16j16.4 isoform X3 n=1 Tax=Hemiscyllium ocellatum TaxID=170820 RepID=UPI002965E97B|nr:uncharacterized protein si:dkey-16j16.4 isoform X3 [Hemiscyllium ocellatum]